VKGETCCGGGKLSRFEEEKSKGGRRRRPKGGRALRARRQRPDPKGGSGSLCRRGKRSKALSERKGVCLAAVRAGITSGAKKRYDETKGWEQRSICSSESKKGRERVKSTERSMEEGKDSSLVKGGIFREWQ